MNDRRNLSRCLLLALLAVSTACSQSPPPPVAQPKPAPAAPIVAKDSRPSAQEFVGRVVAIADGDTLTVLDAQKRRQRIRLEGIDAPESRQAFGQRAKEALGKKVFGQEVRLVWRERDRYDRIIATVYLGSRSINHELLAEGWAWHFKRFNQDAELDAAERSARAARRGLWVDRHPTAPWDYRKQGGSTHAQIQPLSSSSFLTAPTIVYVTASGHKYHREACRYHQGEHPLPLARAAADYQPCEVCCPTP